MIDLTWKLTANLTARVTVDSVTLPVTLAVTLTVRPDQRTADFGWPFRRAPAPLEALSNTPPRPLIPPNHGERDQRPGLVKTTQNEAGTSQIFTKRYGYGPGGGTSEGEQVRFQAKLSVDRKEGGEPE